MAESVSGNTQQSPEGGNPHPPHDAGDGRRSGEGAASAMAHMISQDKNLRPSENTGNDKEGLNP